MDLQIETKTTGFGSPAESYVEKRLDLNQLIVDDVYTTYYFKWGSEEKMGLKKGDILVVDRASLPKEGDLVLVENNDEIKLEIFNHQNNQIWGTVTWTLSQIKK